MPDPPISPESLTDSDSTDAAQASRVEVTEFGKSETDEQTVKVASENPADESLAPSAPDSHGKLPPEDPSDAIRVRGARTHNLQNVDVDIPRDSLVVITGVSGSGKSSLAFDTVFAEGQRQYIESLSVYARQYLDQAQRPEVDWIDGLQPTIAIDQHPGSHNPRSTVATVTEIYDYLRLLFARVGQASCYECGESINQQSATEIQDEILKLPQGTKAMILAPLVRGRRGAHVEVFDAIRKAGLVRARVDGQVYAIEDVPELAPRKNHTIEAVTDRIIIRDGIASRLGESLRMAIKLSEGLLLVSYLDNVENDQAQAGNAKSNSSSNGGTWTDRLFSTKYACANCKISFEELEPRSFSFNSPYGACPTCEGLGTLDQFDPELVIPDPDMPLSAGAIAPWKGPSGATAKKSEDLVREFVTKSNKTNSKNGDSDTPLSQWRESSLKKLLHGDGKKFLGVMTLLEKEYVTCTAAKRRERLETYRGAVLCSECGGARLRREALACRIHGSAIHELTALSVGEARIRFEQIQSEIDEEKQPIAEPILKEISQRLAFLEKVGVDYLTLDRSADTLSGGEMQRVRLATGIGSGLVGVCYLLDEPSIGLHPRDNQRLIEALRDLQQQGNTVVVVEHDEQMMREADHLIDIGPGAGRYGGRVVAAGDPQDVINNPDSLTGRYLSGDESIPLPDKRRKTAKSRSITIEGATTNNLKSVDAQIPLEAFVCFTGVSGSGKSSLVLETLARALRRRLGDAGAKPGPHTSLRGASQIDRLVEVDQSPIGRTPRSNPATYCGVFDDIRKVFAGTKEARQRGYKANRFSFNVKSGRCETCQGHGRQKIEMNFLPDMYVPCAECAGARFNRQTLSIRFRGCSIADVLEMSVDDATEFFENHPPIHRMLESLQSVGLGYLPLGQPSTTISGGEAQRIKLATELGRAENGSTLYILDEPTTGLHSDDIRRLLEVLSRLVDRGNTVWVIEHHLDVMKTADWILDLGPEGGSQGGRLVASGTPKEIANVEESHTGQYLKACLK